MKLIFRISALSLMLACLPTGRAGEIPRLHDEYDPAKWPSASLRLSQAATLIDVFGSGLRPYRFPGLENTTLEVKHLSLSLELGSGTNLPRVSTELMRIKPFTDGEIATIEGFTPMLTLEQAREEMLKWLPYAANGRTQQDLDEYIEAVKADFLDFDDPYRGIAHGFGIGWNEPGFGSSGGGAKCGLGFRKTTNESHPLRLHFGFDWGLNRPIKDRGSFRPEPIAPPPGYEHVDMTAPARFGPDSMVDILRSKGVDIGDGRGGISQDEYFGRSSLSTPEPAPPARPIQYEASKPTPPPSRWWMVVGLVIVFGSGFGLRRWWISRR